MLRPLEKSYTETGEFMQSFAVQISKVRFKNIQFKASPIVIQAHRDQNILPQPIKLNIPKWFKSLNHGKELKTIKGCIPFLETLQTGYLIRNYQDTHIKHNILTVRGLDY